MLYSIGSLFISRIDRIPFNSITADIQLPVIDPKNTIPGILIQQIPKPSEPLEGAFRPDTN